MKNDKQLFVVPTKEDVQIFECVKAINKHHPDADILIVDSDSDNKNYMKTIGKNYKNIIVSKFKNKNYEFGAIVHSFLNYRYKYDIFFFIQDSIIVKEKINLDQLDENSALVFYYCRNGWKAYNENQIDIIHSQYPDFFNHPDYISATGHHNVQYNSFIIRSSTFGKCFDSEIFSLIGPPKNKHGSVHWERLWTSVLMSNGVTVQVLENATRYIKKIHLNRQ